MAGVSQRATYNCLKKFEEMGVIERSNGDRDRRFHVVSINPEVFCREFCDQIPNGGQELPMAFSESGELLTQDTPRTSGSFVNQDRGK